MSLFSAAENVDPSNRVRMEYSLLWAEHQQVIQKIQDLEKEIASLKEQMLLMRQRHFGKKTEIGKALVTDNQLQTVSGYVRQKGKKTIGRNIDTSGLPRYKIYHESGENHQNCHCGNFLKIIGEEVSEQLEVVPLRLYVIEHIRGKILLSPVSYDPDGTDPKSNGWRKFINRNNNQ